MEKKRQRKRNGLKKKMLSRLLYVGAIILFIVQGVCQQPIIDANKAQIAKLEQEIEYEKQRAKEVDFWAQRVDTDEYIEKVARTKLGYVKSNEKIFIDASKSGD